MVDLPFEAKSLGGGEYSLPCPECGKTGNALKGGGFSFSVDKGVGGCFSCGFSCHEKNFHRFFGGGQQVERKVEFKTMSTDGKFEDAFYVPEARSYLVKRGYPYATDPLNMHLANNIGILWSAPRLYFPLWSPFGEHPVLISRTTDPEDKVRWRNFPINKNRYLFGKMPTGKTVVVVEGVWHVLSSGFWGKALAILGKSCSQEMVGWLLTNFDTIVVWLDAHEPAGLVAAQELVVTLQAYGEHHHIHLVKSLRELGETEPEEAERILEGALRG